MDNDQVGIELNRRPDDCQFWLDHATFSADEIAIRFKYRPVAIHCFANGSQRAAFPTAYRLGSPNILIACSFTGEVGSPARVKPLNRTKTMLLRTQDRGAYSREDENLYNQLLMYSA